MISCAQLTKRYGKLSALDAVSFEIQKGEICAVLGPNGAGKSTLVNMLCGLLAPDGGKIDVAGRDPSKRESAFRRSIGVVPDGLALLPELSIEEHLFMSGPIYGLDRQTTRSRSEQLLRILDLTTKRRTYARECSHGMRKKTALAMALLHSPEVLFLDEPFEGIDPVSAETIRLALRAASARGITILLTSHILSLVDRVADRLILLRSGQMIWNSTMAELSGNVESLYFELAETPNREDIPWLQSRP